MIQKHYHVTNFSDGSFEQILQEVSVLPAYQEAMQVLLTVFEQDWDVEEIKRKTVLLKEILPKAEIMGITNHLEVTWEAGVELKNKSLLNFFFFERPSFVMQKFFMDDSARKNIAEIQVGRWMQEAFRKQESLKGVMVFCAEYLKNVDIMMEEAGRNLSDIPLFGTTANRNPEQENYVFDEDGVYEHCVLLALFYGKHLQVKVSYNLGWTSVGRKMTITKMDGNFRVLEIDHRPAMDIYKKYLGLTLPEEIQMQNICEFPLMVSRNGLSVARVGVRAETDGSLEFATVMKEGERIQFTYGAPANIFSEIRRNSLEFQDFAPQGMLLVVCGNRIILLKEQELREIEFYENVAPELACLHGNSEIYFYNGAGGELNSALIAFGIKEDGTETLMEPRKEECCFQKKKEEMESEDFLIPLEYRVMTFMSAVTRDLETMAERANAANEAKSAFLSSMSHEIRTPINAVLGMDEMILRESEEEHILEYAENIRVAGNTLLGLINDILDFSKIEAGKMELVEAEYETASSLHDLVNMISMRAKNKGLELKTKIDPNLPSLLYGDEVRIKQVITNILTNAVKYTEEGSVTFTVTSEKKDRNHVNLFISIKDTGIGIKEEDLGKLFTAFERIEEQRNRSIEGTGLGMNITNRLLAMMGSELSVSSVYGEGSDFFFTLEQKVHSWDPIGDIDTAWKNSVQNHERYVAGFTAPDAWILAVDDTEMNLAVLRGLLKPMQIQIDAVASGQECLEMVTQKKYDIIFLDHRMPKMDGMETKKRMQELVENQNKETPVIALTANAVSGAREEYLRNGFTDYLTKPIDTEDLEEMLKKYLPEEKLKAKEAPEGNRNHEDREEHTSTKESVLEIKEALSSVDGLDYHYARLHLPTEELLISAIEDFYKVITLHADRLEEMYSRLPEKEAVEEYRIQVHGMKSSAATIGIVSLAGMAKILEDAANKEDVEKIRTLHGTFLSLWREYQGRFEEALGFGTEKTGEKLPFDSAVFKGLLEILTMSMEDFDIEKTDETLKLIEAYEYPEEMEQKIQTLSSAISDVDFEAAGEVVEKLLG